MGAWEQQSVGLAAARTADENAVRSLVERVCSFLDEYAHGQSGLLRRTVPAEIKPVLRPSQLESL